MTKKENSAISKPQHMSLLGQGKKKKSDLSSANAKLLREWSIPQEPQGPQFHSRFMGRDGHPGCRVKRTCKVAVVREK